MLVHLAIRNLAIIEDTELELRGGLNVLTGETGAGKSIVLGALALVLGDRAKTDAIRRGAERAEVQALFRVPAGSAVAERLQAHDLLDPMGEAREDPEVELVIRRVIAPGGRGRVYINGALTTVSVLAEITRGLVDISSQHQHTTLLDPGGHLELLDRFGELDDPRRRYDDAWETLVAARAARDALRERERARVQREDYVRFQVAEIDEVAPVAGEEEELGVERERLVHAEKLVGGARAIEDALAGGESSAGGSLRGAAREAERLAAIDPQLRALADRLESARIEVEDVAFEMRRYGQGVDMDPRRLAMVEDRLDSLRRLKRKHGRDLAEVLERAAELRAELEAFESLELEVDAADKVVEEGQGEAWKAAEALSTARRTAAAELGRLVNAELADLAMEGAATRFELARRDELGPDGVDVGELLIRTNVGEAFMPVARVASGGELSRLLLALKRALSRVDPSHAAVFDEVDSGVGGATAEVIGLKLREIAGERQVIVITHLPQIAAQAKHHLRVEKGLSGGRAVTRVTHLDEAARRDELARMLGGLRITEQTRAHADELLSRGGGTGA